MIDVAELVARVRQAGARFEVEGDKLRVRPARVIPAELAGALRGRKAALLDFLRGQAATPAGVLARLDGLGVKVEARGNKLRLTPAGLVTADLLAELACNTLRRTPCTATRSCTPVHRGQ